LALRSVQFARNHGVRLHVRSSFTWEPGTWVEEEDETMERAIISAITHGSTEAKVTVSGVPDRPAVAARLFRALADRGINVEMISTSTIRISCVVRGDAVDRAVQVRHDVFELDANA